MERKPGIIAEVPVSAIQVADREFCFEAVKKMMLEGEHCDHTHYVTCCLTDYFDNISKKIAKFSGDKEVMNGGTIGDPQTPPVWAPFVTKAFFDALWRDSQIAWVHPPRSRTWNTIHYWSNYLYDVVLWAPDSE